MRAWSASGENASGKPFAPQQVVPAMQYVWALPRSLFPVVSGIHLSPNNCLTVVCCCFCRTQIKIETLEDAIVLDNPEDDLLHDKRGCPVYVSPEIIKSHMPYSGRCADMWSLGVVLYTMLVGRFVN